MPRKSARLGDMRDSVSNHVNKTATNRQFLYDLITYKAENDTTINKI